MVSEAIFPTNKRYVSIEKWSWIFVSGTGSARTESEEKATLHVLKWPLESVFFMRKSEKKGPLLSRTAWPYE